MVHPPSLPRPSRESNGASSAGRHRYEICSERTEPHKHRKASYSSVPLDVRGVANKSIEGQDAMTQDIFLRAHTVAPMKSSQESLRLTPEKWPTKILVFDTETTLDTSQGMTFGVYQLCELIDGKYIVAEEGLFYADDLDTLQRKMIEDYAKTNFASIEKKSFPPKVELKVYSRWEFVERVFWKAIKQDRLIVGFNLPFDLSRLAVRWGKADNDGWSLILSQRVSRKTKNLEGNPHRPRVTINAPFIATTKPEEPSEWPQPRFLDLHTLAFALYGESESLESLCGRLRIPGKIKHDPTGKVTIEEIDYCREDVRATTRALNEVRQEFDRHPIQLDPTKAYSPASIAKAYLDAMGVVPPKDKFSFSNDILGIAMQAYYGGRAECRLRKLPVPVIHTDFKSQYPTVNTLLQNWKVLTAADISFEDATGDVRRLLNRTKFEDLFDPRYWQKLSFFALVKPDRDIFPVRTVYNGTTQNIGVNELTSAKPIWFAGPDVIASILLAGKVPQIEKAIRMVPHGQQEGLTPTNLRGMVRIDPRKHDFFRYVVEQREKYKSDKVLGGFLKDVANSGSYGLFVEINPDKKAKPVTISVFSGEKSFQQKSQLIEKHGKWYFPPVAALITAGGRLLLAMLERGVKDEGGTYLFCDTDSLCIVAAEKSTLLPCPGGSYKLNGRDAIKVLSRKQVQNVANKFKALNPYDPTVVPEILKIESVNFDANKKFTQLTGFAISAKRYTLYHSTKSKISIVDPKAHGLGYLYPPIEPKEGSPHWTSEAWDWMLRGALGLTRSIPKWVDLPAMMRIVLSTPHVLSRLDYETRPYNFLFCPLIDGVAGYPQNVDPQQFTVITQFTKDRDQWIHAQCTNVCDGKVYQLALTQNSKLEKLIPQTFGYVLRLYLSHPEAKSLAPDGTPCVGDTQGLLRRASVVAKEIPRFVGKETDRRWSQVEDASLLTFSPIEYQPDGNVVADSALRKQISRCGMRPLIRQTGLSQHTIEAIRLGKEVRRSTLARIQTALESMKGEINHAVQEPRM